MNFIIAFVNFINSNSTSFQSLGIFHFQLMNYKLSYYHQCSMNLFSYLQITIAFDLCFDFHNYLIENGYTKMNPQDLDWIDHYYRKYYYGSFYWY